MSGQVSSSASRCWAHFHQGPCESVFQSHMNIANSPSSRIRDLPHLSSCPQAELCQSQLLLPSQPLASFPSTAISCSPWWLESSHDGNIYPLDTDTCYKTGFVFVFLLREPVVKHLTTPLHRTSRRKASRDE